MKRLLLVILLASMFGDLQSRASSNSSSKKGISGAELGGILGGSLAGLVVIGLIAIYIKLRKNASKSVAVKRGLITLTPAQEVNYNELNNSPIEQEAFVDQIYNDQVNDAKSKIARELDVLGIKSTPEDIENYYSTSAYEDFKRLKIKALDSMREFFGKYGMAVPEEIQSYLNADKLNLDFNLAEKIKTTTANNISTKLGLESDLQSLLTDRLSLEYNKNTEKYELKINLKPVNYNNTEEVSKLGQLNEKLNNNGFSTEAGIMTPLTSEDSGFSGVSGSSGSFSQVNYKAIESTISTILKTNLTLDKIKISIKTYIKRAISNNLYSSADYVPVQFSDGSTAYFNTNNNSWVSEVAEDASVGDILQVDSEMPADFFG